MPGRFRTSSPPEGINPGRESRAERAIWWLSIIVVLAFLAWPLVATLLFGPTITLGWLLGPAAAAVICSIALHHLVVRVSRREVIAADYCLCLECRYPLGALPPTGVCPECGATYEHEQVRKCWQWTLDEGWRS